MIDFAYIESSLPEDRTISEYRRARPGKARPHFHPLRAFGAWLGL